MAYDVFISYSSLDKAVAETIVATLEKNNIRCWYALRDIQPGADWGEAIAKAIDESSIFLLIFSANANQSRRVLDELNMAITKDVIILPFRIEKLDPPLAQCCCTSLPGIGWMPMCHPGRNTSTH